MNDDALARALEAVSQGAMVSEDLDADSGRILAAAARLAAAGRVVEPPPGAFARAVARAQAGSPATGIGAGFALLRRVPAVALVAIAVLLATGLVGLAAVVTQRSVPLAERNGCAAALAVRSDALDRIARAHARAGGEVRAGLQEAQQSAVTQNRGISAAALAAIAGDAIAELDRIRDGGPSALRNDTDLGRCETSDPDTGAVFDIADLRRRYDIVVERIATDLVRATRAGTARLSAAVQGAPQRSVGSMDDD